MLQEEVSFQFLTGGEQMAATILAKDWAATSLGPIEAWPQSLRTTVSLCVASNFPISIAWGPQRVQIYNDGYWPICAAKHPHSMGQDFKIYLPRVVDVTVETKTDRTNDRPRGQETLLLAEDEPMILLLASAVLRAQGYTVLEAPNGLKALRLAEEYTGRIDLLLTDVVMPQMGGKELAGRLQAQRPALRVLYASGYTDDAIVHHGVLDEGVAFLQKPFTPSSLARKVRATLDTP